MSLSAIRRIALFSRPGAAARSGAVADGVNVSVPAEMARSMLPMKLSFLLAGVSSGALLM
jgi:hypothetical protein